MARGKHGPRRDPLVAGRHGKCDKLGCVTAKTQCEPVRRAATEPTPSPRQDWGPWPVARGPWLAHEPRPGAEARGFRRSPRRSGWLFRRPAPFREARPTRPRIRERTAPVCPLRLRRLVRAQKTHTPAPKGSRPKAEQLVSGTGFLLGRCVC